MKLIVKYMSWYKQDNDIQYNLLFYRHSLANQIHSSVQLFYISFVSTGSENTTVSIWQSS